jgi:hypothetical protein
VGIIQLKANLLYFSKFIYFSGKDVERGKRMRRRRGREGDEIVSLSHHMLNKQ